MKKKLAFLLLSFFLVGCAQSSPSGSGEISIQITKSPTNTQKIEVRNSGQAKNLAELMNQTGITFKTEMHDTSEFVRELGGVIATASKSWKLYINGQISHFTTLSDIKINQPLTIEWRYEENK